MKCSSILVVPLTIAASLVWALAAYSAPTMLQGCSNLGAVAVPGEIQVADPISCGVARCPAAIAITYTYQCSGSAGKKCEVGQDVLFEYHYWKCVNGECMELTIRRNGPALTTVPC